METAFHRAIDRLTLAGRVTTAEAVRLHFQVYFRMQQRSWQTSARSSPNSPRRKAAGALQRMAWAVRFG